VEEIWQDFKVEIVETLQTSNFKAKCNVHINISRIGIWKSIIEVKMTNLPKQMLQWVHYILYCASIKVLEVQLQMQNINVLVVREWKVDTNLWFIELESWRLATKWSTMNIDSRFICNLLQTPHPQCTCFLLEVGYNNEHWASLKLKPLFKAQWWWWQLAKVHVKSHWNQTTSHWKWRLFLSWVGKSFGKNSWWRLGFFANPNPREETCATSI